MSLQMSTFLSSNMDRLLYYQYGAFTEVGMQQLIDNNR